MSFIFTHVFFCPLFSHESLGIDCCLCWAIFGNFCKDLESKPMCVWSFIPPHTTLSVAIYPVSPLISPATPWPHHPTFLSFIKKELCCLPCFHHQNILSLSREHVQMLGHDRCSVSGFITSWMFYLFRWIFILTGAHAYKFGHCSQSVAHGRLLLNIC